MKTDIWMPIYINDYIGDTMELDDNGHGIYLMLMFHYWKKGPLTKNITKLMRIARTENEALLSEILDDYFIDGGEKYVHKRIEEEKGKANSRRDSASLNGKKGGRPKGDHVQKTKDDQWDEMLKYFNNTCLCCGAVFSNGDRPTKDHIIPQENGGVDEIYNIQPLCRECNSSKCADHNTDYRLKYKDNIPKYLLDKWFINNPQESNGLANHNPQESNGLANHNPQKSSSPSPSPSPSPSYTSSKEEENNNSGEKKTNIFKKPLVHEIKDYCHERNNSVNPDQFFDHYESKGWMIGKNKMKDWKASVRTWERSSFQQPGKKTSAFDMGGNNFEF